jgi:serine/threonine-protein kinase
MDSQSPVADTHLGKSIGGYQIVKRVGQSNLSTAYLAQSQKHGQAVIFTTFTLPERFSRQARERFNERFMRVVAALVRLRHSHIAPVYDFGMQPEYLYTITALTPADTLATLAPRQPHLSTTFVLDMMRQIAEGIDYAHRSGVIHGSLSSSNILLVSRQQVQIAGFSLVQLLALSDIELLQHPYAHVLSVAMTFLGNPYSIAPEVVQGAPVAPAADIYALGILLYEMLSGQPPFVEADPLKTALARLNTPVPSLGELRPDLPLSLDQVVQKALAYDPVQRYASGESLVQAFEQVLRAGDTAKQATVTTKQGVVLPAMNGQNLDDSTSGSAQARATYSTRDINQRANQEIYQQGIGALPISAVSQQQVVGEGLNPPTEGAMDPFARWSPATLSVDEEQAFTWVGGGQTPGSFNPGRRPPVNAKRRRLVTALVAGGIVLGGLGGGGAVLAHLVQGSSNVQGHARQVASNIAKPTPTPQPTKTVQPGPTAKPKPSPTAKPKPSPTPTPSPAPSHTGVVVGSMNQGNNTSTTFTNPADDNDSLLIRLPNGNFVAFESDCPHEGVTCHYDAGIQKIVCPRHTAYFDPFNNAAVLQGPPKRPLPSVPVHINSDGTVTVG